MWPCSMSGLTTITMPEKKMRSRISAAAWSCLFRLLISLIFTSACLPRGAFGQSSPSSGDADSNLDQEEIIRVTGIRLTSPLDGWVLTRIPHSHFFIIHYHLALEELKADLLTPSLTCLTKAFMGHTEIFSMELSAETGYAVSAFTGTPYGTCVCLFLLPPPNTCIYIHSYIHTHAH
jgi:hypothetical protein